MANNIYELDFTGVQSNSYIPEGTHNVTISGAEFKKASTGSDQLQVTFQTADGAIRSAWFSLLPQALWKVKGFLETIGIPCEGKIKLNTKAMIGKKLKIVVESDINDETKLVISRFEKLIAETPVANYQAQPVQPVQQAQQPVQAATPTQPQSPVQPPWMTSQQNAQSVPNNLPPWMTPQQPVQPVQQAQQPVQNNLPPWMQQK